MASSFHCSQVFLEQTCVTTKLLLAMKSARMRGFLQPSISFLVVLLPGCLTGMLSTHGRQQNEIHILHSNTSNSNLRHSASKKQPSSSSRCLVACLHPLDLWHLPSVSVLFFAAPVLAATRVPGFHPWVLAHTLCVHIPHAWGIPRTCKPCWGCAILFCGVAGRKVCVRVFFSLKFVIAEGSGRLIDCCAPAAEARPQNWFV